MRKLAIFMLLTALLLITHPTLAYVGPGLGLGTIGVILGVVFSVLLAFFAVLWYPVKKFIKKRYNSKSGSETKTK